MGNRLAPVKRKRTSLEVLPLEGKSRPVVAEPEPVTLTVTALLEEPPAPLQFSVNVLEARSAPVETLPLTDWAPLQAPLAEQLVALVDDQVKAELPPLATLEGLEESEMAGTGAGAGAGAGKIRATPLYLFSKL